MRRFAIKRWVAAGWLVLLPLLADAAGLGRLTILSSLGEPLTAEIELVSLQKDELPTLSARLAPPDAYRQANLQYNPALSGLRMTIERRGSSSFIKVTSPRAVNEPFIDLLVELSWASGRIIREYTALIDPPGFANDKQPVAPVVVAPAPKAAAPAPAAKPVAAPIERAPAPAANTKEYGPIKRGETLAKVAAAVKPGGVSLEQMLVGLYRSNPDAFQSNMNRMKAGRILRVPDKEEIAAIPRPEAVSEVRAQAADWNKYRGTVADQAVPASAGGSAASGRITAKVDDKAAAEPGKDVVRLSKGEPPKGSAQAKGGADRVRALEEEAIARDKSLKEAQDRIAQLEKTIKDQQKLLELKNASMAAAQQSAAKGEAKKDEARKDEAKAAPKPADTKAAPEAKKEEAKKEESKKEEAKKEEAKKDDSKKDDSKKSEAPAADKGDQPKPKPKVAAPPPPPPPEPDLVDMVLDEPLYLGGGLGVLLLGGVGLWYVKRRRMAAALKSSTPAPVMIDELSVDSDSTAVMPTMAVSAAATAGAAAAMAPGTEDVDALAEAEVYLAYGRDTQAEEILKEAQEKFPDRHEITLKLLEIYASRKDVSTFNSVATGLHNATGGMTDTWVKVAGMGYSLDPDNALYEAGRDTPTIISRAAEPAGSDLDFDLGGDAGTTTDITLDAGPGESTEATQQFASPVEVAAAPAAQSDDIVFDIGASPADSNMVDIGLDVPPAAEQPVPAAEAEPMMPDFTLDFPSGDEPKAEEPVVAVEEPKPASDPNVLDFDLALPDAEPVVPAAIEVPVAASSDDPGLDFKLDLGDINLNLDEPKADAGADGKDGHWYDVQQKFDLAKAYQEMGDKDGARDILQEVLKEGDAQQQEDAKKLLETIV